MRLLECQFEKREMYRKGVEEGRSRVSLINTSRALTEAAGMGRVPAEPQSTFHPARRARTVAWARDLDYD